MFDYLLLCLWLGSGRQRIQAGNRLLLRSEGYLAIGVDLPRVVGRSRLPGKCQSQKGDDDPCFHYTWDPIAESHSGSHDVSSGEKEVKRGASERAVNSDTVLYRRLSRVDHSPDGKLQHNGGTMVTSLVANVAESERSDRGGDKRELMRIQGIGQ